MNFKVVILLSVLMLCSLSTASADTWVSNSSMVTGLGDVGDWSALDTFYMDGSWKLIAGNLTGDFTGYDWNGTGWESNASLINGLSNGGDRTKPEIFNQSGNWKMVVGLGTGSLTGFEWNGTGWTSNATVVSGLTDPAGIGKNVEIFDVNGTFKCILGNYNGEFNGYYWSGSTWSDDTDIVSGLVEADSYFTPTVLNDSGTLFLINGDGDGTFTGYQWSGTTWISNSNIVSRLGDIGSLSAPEILIINSTRQFISGNSTGEFTGFTWNAIPTTSNLRTEHVINNSQVYTNASTPFFNWTFADNEGDTQHSWEIEVGTASGLSDMWNSGQLTGANLSDNYAGSTLTRNTTYYIQVRTNDSYQWSEWTYGTFKLNALPTVNNIVITPGAPLDTDDLVVSNDTAVDGNGDPTVVYYKWYKDDVHQPALNNIVTINASNTTADDVWKVGVIPNDGYENGTEVFSATVTIGSGNYAPTISSITTNVSTKKFNYTILVSTVNAFDQNGDNYTLHVGNSTGADNLCNSSTTLNGTEASCVFTVPWTSGSHVIYGHLTDANDTSVEKNIVFTVDVTPPVALNGSVSQTSITTDETTDISVNVTVANGSVDWVYAKIMGPDFASTNYTMTQGANDSWSYTFTPTVGGNHLITNFYAADDSGNVGDDSVSLAFIVATGGGGGGGGGVPTVLNITEVGDLTLTPDKRDTYMLYTAIKGEQSGTWTFIANRNLENCSVEPNSYASCKIIDGYIVEVTIIANETTKSYNGVLTVVDATDHITSSKLIVRVWNVWGSIPIGEINVGPLSTISSPLFETEGSFLIGIKTWFVFSIIGFFGFALYKSRYV